VSLTRKGKLISGTGALVVIVAALLLAFTFVGMPGGGTLRGTVTGACTHPYPQITGLWYSRGRFYYTVKASKGLKKVELWTKNMAPTMNGYPAPQWFAPWEMVEEQKISGTEQSGSMIEPVILS